MDMGEAAAVAAADVARTAHTAQQRTAIKSVYLHIVSIDFMR